MTTARRRRAASSRSATRCTRAARASRSRRSRRSRPRSSATRARSCTRRLRVVVRRPILTRRVVVSPKVFGYLRTAAEVGANRKSFQKGLAQVHGTWNGMEWNGMEWNGIQVIPEGLAHAFLCGRVFRPRVLRVVVVLVGPSSALASASRGAVRLLVARCRGLLGATARVFSSRRAATPSVGARGRRPVTRRCDRRRDHRTNRCVSCDRTRRGRRRQLLAEGAVQMLKQRGDLDGADPLLAAVGELQFEVGTLSTDSLATTTATAPAARRTAGRRRSLSLKTRRDR